MNSRRLRRRIAVLSKRLADSQQGGAPCIVAPSRTSSFKNAFASVKHALGVCQQISDSDDFAASYLQRVIKYLVGAKAVLMAFETEGQLPNKVTASKGNMKKSAKLKAEIRKLEAQLKTGKTRKTAQADKSVQVMRQLLPKAKELVKALTRGAKDDEVDIPALTDVAGLIQEFVEVDFDQYV